jgi:hypothetical protein
LVAVLRRDVEVLMPFQRFHERGEKGEEAFGADAIGSIPEQQQRLLDFWPVVARALVPRCLQHVLGMGEQPPA